MLSAMCSWTRFTAWRWFTYKNTPSHLGMEAHPPNRVTCPHAATPSCPTDHRTPGSSPGKKLEWHEFLMCRALDSFPTFPPRFADPPELAAEQHRAEQLAARHESDCQDLEKPLAHDLGWPLTLEWHLHMASSSLPGTALSSDAASLKTILNIQPHGE